MMSRKDFSEISHDGRIVLQGQGGSGSSFLFVRPNMRSFLSGRDSLVDPLTQFIARLWVRHIDVDVAIARDKQLGKKEETHKHHRINDQGHEPNRVHYQHPRLGPNVRPHVSLFRKKVMTQILKTVTQGNSQQAHMHGTQFQRTLEASANAHSHRWHLQTRIDKGRMQSRRTERSGQRNQTSIYINCFGYIKHGGSQLQGAPNTKAGGQQVQCYIHIVLVERVKLGGDCLVTVLAYKDGSRIKRNRRFAFRA
mmetsp:Transcript_14913/g.19521  ORF Transcript_14913/g.19521 Transcript_14913/m.19521 type:complete len:252 (+) Transcript_14913:333-1088(+)